MIYLDTWKKEKSNEKMERGDGGWGDGEACVLYYIEGKGQKGAN